jgi:hypothetical protein
MANLFWRFNGDAATVTAGSADTDYPVSNVLNPLLAKTYKTGTSSADEWVKFDLGSAQDIDAFAVLSHTLVNGTDTLVIEGNASDSWGSPSFSDTMTIAPGPIVHYLSSLEAYRWWRFKITKGAAGNQESFGRILLGQQYTLSQNPTERMVTWGWEDTSEGQRTRGGQYYSDGGVSLRSLSVRLDYMPQAQADEIQSLIETYGEHTPFLFSLAHDIEPSDWAIYGTLDPVPGAMTDRTWSSVATWATSLNIVEQR